MILELGFILVIFILILWLIHQKLIISGHEDTNIISITESLEMSEKITAFEMIKTDFNYTQSILDFLDRIIKNKYNFYMYTELMPIYLDQKVPEKRIVSELKEKIYVSVVGGLTIKTKKSILDLFTEKGIEIYIHERIMILMNETDFKTSGKFSEAFKDLNPRRMDGIIP